MNFLEIPVTDEQLPVKRNKYNYWLIIQQYFNAYGWEDVSHYEATSTKKPIEMSDKPFITPKGKERKESLLSADLREYKTMGYPTRVIFRKELNK